MFNQNLLVVLKIDLGCLGDETWRLVHIAEFSIYNWYIYDKSALNRIWYLLINGIFMIRVH